MKTSYTRFLGEATFGGLLSLTSGIAFAAAPTVSQVYFDLTTTPRQVNIVGSRIS